MDYSEADQRADSAFLVGVAHGRAMERQATAERIADEIQRESACHTDREVCPGCEAERIARRSA